MQTLFEVEPSFASALASAGLADFDAMMKVRGGDATSRHLHRETLPIQVAIDGRATTFYLKRVFKVPFKHAVKPWLRGAPGRTQPHREWLILGELKAVGIPAMGRAAFGERRSWGVPTGAFILVEAVPMPHTLEDWLVPGFPKPAVLDESARRQLLFEVGRLVGRLHAEGFRWPDLHAKHVYAAASNSPEAEKWTFCLIDVERMERVLPADVDVKRELRALVKSVQPTPFSQADLESLWSGYCQSASRRKDSIPSTLRPDALPRLPDDYEHPRSSPARGRASFLARKGVGDWLEALHLASLDDVFAFQNGASLTKQGLGAHRERIRLEVPGDNGRLRVLYLKRYHQPPLREQFRRLREGSPFISVGCHEAKMIKRLGQIGVPTMRWVACGQAMRMVWEQRSFGITEALDGISLESYVRDAGCERMPFPSCFERREIIRQAALVVRRLHQNRLFHRDLYLSHLFLTRNSDGSVVIRVIDLARMLEKPASGRRWEIKDLAALDYSSPPGVVTRADRLRFLRAYDDNLHDRKKLRHLLQQVQAKVSRISRHDSRRRSASAAGRPS